jgi:hypothetical protein
MKVNPKLRKTIVCLRILSVINFVIGAVFLLASFIVIPFAFPFAVLIIGWGIFIEFVIKDLKQRKYWAWVAGLIISGLTIASILFVLGIIALIGLLDTQKDFKQ